MWLDAAYLSAVTIELFRCDLRLYLNLHLQVADRELYHHMWTAYFKHYFPFLKNQTEKIWTKTTPQGSYRPQQGYVN